MKTLRIVVGFDQREAVAHHVFCQSLISRSSLPVEIIPLSQNLLAGYTERHKDGSNAFIYSRFLTPYLCNFEGAALFVDGDMICQADIKNLFDMFDPSKALQVVKHDYKTKAEKKYLGNKNENYPRKNWSSVILWNCGHPDHKILTPEFIEKGTGAYLHRFSWLKDELIGELPREWNWLATEYPDNPSAKIIHYTLGTPCFKDYKNAPMADLWWKEHARTIEGIDV